MPSPKRLPRTGQVSSTTRRKDISTEDGGQQLSADRHMVFWNPPAHSVEVVDVMDPSARPPPARGARRSVTLQRHQDQVAFLETLNTLYPFFFTELRRCAVALAISRTGVQGAFLRRFKLDTPWLRLYIRRHAQVLAEKWHSQAPPPDISLLTNADELLGRRRLNARRSAIAALGNVVMTPDESGTHYVSRATEYARRVDELSRSLDETRYPVRAPELDRDMVWFILVHVLYDEPADRARADGVARGTVDRAIRRVSKRLEIPLRDLPRRGRRAGISETLGRRRIQK